MNKTYIMILGTALLALAACSRDEVKEIGNEPLIDFRIAVDTRATETTTDNIQSFFVTAIDETGAVYFKDVEYSDADNDGSFTSESPFYWPAGGSLKFYAYAPGTTRLGGTVVISNEAQTLTGYTVPADFSNHADFITAYAEGSKVENATGVELTFEHRFSQIEVRARNTNQGYVYKVAGVKFGKIASTGGFDFGDSKWTDLGTKTNFVSEYDAAVSIDATAKSIMGANGNAMMLPQALTGWDNESDKTNTAEGSYISVKVNIKTASGMTVYPTDATTEYGWVSAPVSNTWEAGKHYIYTLDFTTGAGMTDPDGPDEPDPVFEGAIKFSMDTEVIGWQ